MAARTTSSRLPTRRDETSAPKASSRIPSRSVAPSPTKYVKPTSQSTSIFSRSRTVKAEASQRSKGEVEKPSRSNTATPVLDTPISFEAKPSSTSHFGFRSRAGSASSTDKPKEKPQRNVLRRKPSSNNQRSAYTHNGPLTDSTPSLALSSTPSQSASYSDPYSGSVVGYPAPPTSASPATINSGGNSLRSRSGSTSNSHNDFPYGVPADLTSYNLPPPTHVHPGPSSSPSTRHSESPGPWSRTSTPTSMSSHSPGITMPSKFTTKPRQQSPTRSRPPVTRLRAGSLNNEEIVGPVDVHGLPSLRESVTSSSSSGSTLKGAEKLEKALAGGQTKRRKKRLSPPHPSPPPRKSSQKFKKSLPIDTSQSFPSRNPDSAISGIERSPEDFVEKPMSSHGASASSTSSAGRPVRPSREGAPDLNGASRSNVPVVQSNLTNIQPSRQVRRGSFDKPPASAAQMSSIPARSQAGMGAGLRLVTSNMGSRNPSPSPSQTQSERSLPGSLGPSPDLKHPEMKKPRQIIPSPKSASPAKSATSRFGIFSRKTKPVAEKEKTTDKLSKKGPIAGTGHEGYGRHALRGRGTSQSRERTRSNSAASAAGSIPRGPSSRKGSLPTRNDREVDDFLLDRLDPVVISGGGGTPSGSLYGVDMSRTGSNQSSAAGRPSFDSKMSSSGISVDSKRSNDLAKPSFGFFGAARLTPSVHSAASSRRPSTTSDQEETPRKPSLALRRSLHRSQLFSEKTPLSIPEPINTSASFSSPSIGSQATSQYSGVPLTNDSTLAPADVSEGKEGNWLKPKKAAKEGKSPRKWNFFQRAHNIGQKNTTMTEVSVTITRHQPSRPVAHYALLESADQIDTENINNYMQESQDTFQSPIEVEDASEAEAAELRRQQHARSILLPDPPAIPSGMQNIRPASPKITLRANDEVAQVAQIDGDEKPVDPIPVKRSRLPQVGRIPKVISTRGTENAPPPSAQRAFPLVSSVAEEQNPSIPMSSSNVFLPERTLSPEPVSAGPAPLIPSRPTVRRTGTEDSNQSNFDSNNFLTFPLRNGSVVSYSSSSGGQNNQVTTAIVPQPYAAPAEDEVWNEYDDFLDHVITPNESSKPAALDFKFPFPQIEPDPVVQGKARQKTPKDSRPRPSQVKVPAIKSPPASPLRSSKFHSAATSLIPTTPLSLTDFFAGYGERNLSYTGSAGTRFSLSDAASRVSSASNYSQSQGERLSALKAQPSNSNIGSTAGKEENAARSQINVRFGALMTSKWLSFGRVLFSPAHTEVTAPTAFGQHDRILILDGLGNDDWSFYCALTYPNATVYNLSTLQLTGPISNDTDDSGAWKPPPNHRQIHHPSMDCPFPFPKGFFTAVVFRFPVLSSEATYRMAICECKRVLRPGGYLEVSVLDLDMMNMGNRARRALMGLKVQMQVADSSISLKPTSDNIQRMLGRRGFENLNRCTVGVPAAGSLSDSRPSSLDENSVSLSALLNDHSQKGDEGITNMVAKVGRWWYTRCFETAILPDGDLSRSMWNDDALLRECEKRKTSFKLLICYAQKPLTPRRRTVSV